MEHALGKICLSSEDPVFSEGQAPPSLLLNLKLLFMKFLKKIEKL